MEDLDLTFDTIEKELEGKDKINKRFIDLSEKVRTTSAERDESKNLAAQREIERDNALKERDFFSNYSDVVSKYPGANEFKDKIREKVMAGYDVEDAALAVLGKEGKLGQTQTQQERQSPAGGSATTAMKNEGEKSISEMTREEKRSALLEAEQRGDLSMS